MWYGWTKYWYFNAQKPFKTKSVVTSSENFPILNTSPDTSVPVITNVLKLLNMYSLQFTSLEEQCISLSEVKTQIWGREFRRGQLVAQSLNMYWCVNVDV